MYAIRSYYVAGGFTRVGQLQIGRTPGAVQELEDLESYNFV